MNLNQYQQETRQFARYPHIGSNLWYPALGLSEELGELEEAIAIAEAINIRHLEDLTRDRIVKEAGDCTWNLAQICSEAGLPLEEVVADTSAQQSLSKAQTVIPTPFSQIYRVNQKLSGVIGRYYRDRQTLAAVHPAIADLVGCIWRSLELEMGIRQITMDEILTANLDKLRSRAERGVLQGSGGDR